jgi:hypothetical protein
LVTVWLDGYKNGYTRGDSLAPKYAGLEYRAWDPECYTGFKRFVRL